MKNVIYLIIFYGLICLCVMTFNIINMMLRENRIKFNFNKDKRLKKFIDNQIKLLSENKELDNKNLLALKIKLNEIDNMIIFHDYLLNNLENKNFNKYFKYVKNTLIDLIQDYSKKSSLYKAYYFKFLKDFNLISNTSNEKYEYILYNNLVDNNYYCRLNAFLTICNTTNPKKIISALNKINNSNNIDYYDIIKNGFYEYKGNRGKFLKELEKNKNKYKQNIKKIIDDYINQDIEKIIVIKKEPSNKKVHTIYTDKKTTETREIYTDLLNDINNDKSKNIEDKIVANFNNENKVVI